MQIILSICIIVENDSIEEQIVRYKLLSAEQQALAYLHRGTQDKRAPRGGAISCPSQFHARTMPPIVHLPPCHQRFFSIYSSGNRKRCSYTRRPGLYHSFTTWATLFVYW